VVNRRSTSRTLTRLVAEFVVIVVGVLVALTADTWINQLADREAERAGLQLILTDLAADTARLWDEIGYARQHDRAAAALLLYEDDPPPPDSLASTFRSFLFGSPPVFRRAGFLSLREGGRLSLIQNPELRTQIMSYFEEEQVHVQRWMDEHWERWQVLVDHLAPHVRPPRPRSADSSWPVTGPMLLTSTWAEMRRDPALDNKFMQTGAAASVAIVYAERLLEVNRALQESVREELGQTSP
jgi:type II secretory pathway pseudopilin PulG